MDLPPNPAGHMPFETLSTGQSTALLALARSLQQTLPAEGGRPPLHGKHLALLCAADDGEQARLFRSAAEALGAHVAHVRWQAEEVPSEAELAHAARLFGRLYDAVECQGMPAGLVRQLAAGSGLPVYRDLAGPEHPTARLSELLDPARPSMERRRLALQAALLSSL